MTPQVVDLLTDEDASHVVACYVQAKDLPIAKDCPEVARRLLEDGGLLEDLELLTKLERAYAERAQQAKSSDKLTSLAQARHLQRRRNG